MTTPDVEQIARRFGLRTVSGGLFGLRRHEQTAWFDRAPSTAGVAERHAVFCMCMGARLGLDLRSHAEPRGVGDLEWTQRLVPRPICEIAAAISGRSIRRSTWVEGVPFELVYTRESGKLLVVATDDDELTPDDARRALFYSAYKLRPAATIDVGAGKLRRFATTGGLGSSVASLFPDFDLDASRDHGVLAIPGYDRMLVWRPGSGPARSTSAELRSIVRAAVQEAPLPFSRRLYSLRRDRIIPGEVCGPVGDREAAHLVGNLLEVEA